MSTSNPYSKRRLRLYRWFFTEYNHQWINYKKFYLASSHYQAQATRLNYAVGVFGSLVVAVILAIVRGVDQDLLVPVGLGAALLVGVLSATDAVKGYEQKHVRYYAVGQRLDDLYTEMDHMVKVRLPDPSENDKDLERKCKELVDRKDDLNGSAPQISEKWYQKLKQKERNQKTNNKNENEDPLSWDRPELTDLR